MKIDGSAIFGEQGADALSGDAGSPSASMKGLKYASEVEDLGEETVNGGSTTHYRAVLGPKDLGRFQEAHSGEDIPFGSMTGGASEVTMDVWVGPKDLPVRTVQEFGSMKVSMDFDKFGAAREAQAPPAGETGDLTDEVRKVTEDEGAQG